MTPQLRFPEFTDDWQVKKLGSFSKTFSGGTPTSTNPSFYNGNIPFIKSGEIAKNKTSQNISEEALKKSSAKMVESGDILYALYGATSGQVAISQMNGAINQAILCIRPDANRYFIYSKLAAEKNTILETYLQGGQGNLSADIIKKLPIATPSKPEQEKIADFLTAVDERIRLQEQKLAKLEQYKRGVMQQIFSQKIRFKDENGNEYPEWEEKKLGEVATIKTGKKDANIAKSNGRYRFYTCSRDYLRTDIYSFEGEAILVAGNADVGLCHYYDGKFEAYQRTYVLQNFEIDGKFLYKYLSHFFRQYALGLMQTSAMTYITLGTLQDFTVPLPSEVEQQKIATFLTALDDKITAEKSKLTAVKQFKKALLQRMFV